MHDIKESLLTLTVLVYSQSLFLIAVNGRVKSQCTYVTCFPFQYVAANEYSSPRSIKYPHTLLHPVVQISVNNYYIPVNTTLFPAGRGCCLGQHLQIHVLNLTMAHMPKHALDSELCLLEIVLC
jgi:hypothetical protein